MRILITGASGQVGTALTHALQPRHVILRGDRARLDITQPEATTTIIHQQPELVIHCAAWTDVDGCARDPDRALLVNALGTRHVALACQALDIPLVYISTNEVFDGQATQPYLEFDAPHPINPYGYSKWAGEQIVQQLLRRFYIVRIAWVFGGPRNFVRTVLRLGQERAELAMVDDEIGTPTYAPDLAAAIARLIEQPAYGIYHLTNSGFCSRYEFAAEILRQAGLTQVCLRPIKLADYRRDSTPPRFGALRNFVAATDLGITLRPWQAALADFLAAQQAQPA
ncbi:dTDP-4-dehydrorhamnose reductase [Kallotenue papyrolyticum]|uniref:dTDP-4-dehydrorhamnose reductase n=1 Tax=Kallotenue papyrolyticum TaxID=1325125 RepID=UPI0004785BC6|nr:dTDP-4-dehydrorhamnose reductase [Kallotenue papyrolyticum]